MSDETRDWRETRAASEDSVIANLGMGMGRSG